MKISLSVHATVVSLAASVALASPAQAVPGLVRASATSISDSSTTKAQTAACPAGTQVLGGGGEIVGGGGQVLLSALEPVPGTNGYLARGHEDDDGYTESWQVTAYATCAPGPAGLEYRSRTGSTQSASFGTYVAVQCPSTKHLVGLGGRTNNGNGDVSLEGLGPFDPFEVLVPGAEDPNGYAGLWSLTAHVVCATPIAGRQVLFASTAYDSSSPKTVTVSCPAGQKAHGAGFNGGGATAFGEWLVRSVTPNATLTAVTVSGEEVDGGTAGSWSLTASAVCAP
ncbi:hypothetical protein K1W54_42645 [Micromonospora sp. CPCC 205371]|nr:hypothetical protein [Micromonospora sp. CPCC 205371]